MPTGGEIFALITSMAPYYWWPVVTAVLESIVAGVNKYFERKWKISFWAYAAAFIFSVFIAICLAWIDQHRTAQQLEIDKADLNETLKKQIDRIEDLKKKNEDLLARPPQLSIPHDRLDERKIRLFI